jgi:hypothetical protein
MTARELLGRRRRPEVAGEGDQIAAGFGLERRDRPVDIGRRTATRAPSRARFEAIAAPIPAVLPVTSARLPSSLRSMRIP